MKPDSALAKSITIASGNRRSVLERASIQRDFRRSSDLTMRIAVRNKKIVD
jgi:hypothetical protein